MKVYLYGIQGVYNYGCEAMVRGISEKFKNMYPDCRVIYKTPDLANDSRVLSDCNTVELEPIEKKIITGKQKSIMYRGIRYIKKKLHMDMLPCSVEDIKQYNPLFYRHTYFSEQRDDFFNDFIVDAQGAIEKWTVPAKVYGKSIKGKVFDILPQIIRRWLNERRI